MTTTTYKDAGVDPKRAEDMLEGLNISGFGAVIPLDGEEGLQHKTGHVNTYWNTSCKLVMGTDGVGTKVKIATHFKKYDTIGIDLVAMCVNDVLCHGARPFAFLDYYAVRKIRPKVGKEILKGILEGCRQAGCVLVGGETAEMPGVYAGNKFDLAGFCVGIVHVQDERPRHDGFRGIKVGDAIVGIPSSGLHSNGYSLARKCYDDIGLPYPEEFLTPTRIYVNDVIPMIHKIKGIAHITGGGIHGNLPRCLPDHLTYELSLPQYPWIFKQMWQMNRLTMDEMEHTFNCGWGMMLIVDPIDVKSVCNHIKDAEKLGVVIPR